MGSMLNVPAARIHAYQQAAVEKSRLHIPLLFGADVIHGYRTVYPVPLALAASFDPDLITSLARMAAEEASSTGIRWFYSPMVDISRDARWGRSVEGAGEDAFLGAAMARAYVRGYQSDRLSQPGQCGCDDQTLRRIWRRRSRPRIQHHRHEPEPSFSGLSSAVQIRRGCGRGQRDERLQRAERSSQHGQSLSARHGFAQAMGIRWGRRERLHGDHGVDQSWRRAGRGDGNRKGHSTQASMWT